MAMQKIMLMSIAALAVLVPVAMAEESSTEAAYRSVAQAQEMFASKRHRRFRADKRLKH